MRPDPSTLLRGAAQNATRPTSQALQCRRRGAFERQGRKESRSNVPHRPQTWDLHTRLFPGPNRTRGAQLDHITSRKAGFGLNPQTMHWKGAWGDNLRHHRTSSNWQVSSICRSTPKTTSRSASTRSAIHTVRSLTDSPFSLETSTASGTRYRTNVVNSRFKPLEYKREFTGNRTLVTKQIPLD